jgi:phage/plasmid-like protein (TIGR03299 family)
MQPNQPIETWAHDAGMEYKVQRGVIRYATSRLDEALATVGELKKVEDRLVLFRSDTGAPLGVVSDSYKVVQPREVLEFFREWAQANSVTIESAGVLFGGKRYFATAKMSDGVFVDGAGGKDKVVPYVLLSTSADGSLATEGRITTVRVVCNNTLRLASKGASSFKVSHRSTFKAEECRTIIESAHEEFGAFMDMSRKLASIKVESKLAEDMTALLLTTPTRDADAARDSAGFTRIMALFQGGGKGSTLESSRETAWGWLNSATEFVDHHVRARNDENRTAAALWGPGADLKQRAVEIALAA